MSVSRDAEWESRLDATWIDFRVVVLSHGENLLYHIPLRSSDEGIDVIHKLKKTSWHLLRMVEEQVHEGRPVPNGGSLQRNDVPSMLT